MDETVAARERITSGRGIGPMMRMSGLMLLLVVHVACAGNALSRRAVIGAMTASATVLAPPAVRARDDPDFARAAREALEEQHDFEAMEKNLVEQTETVHRRADNALRKVRSTNPNCDEIAMLLGADERVLEDERRLESKLMNELAAEGGHNGVLTTEVAKARSDEMHLAQSISFFQSRLKSKACASQ
jgi:hypothetical protein